MRRAAVVRAAEPRCPAAAAAAPPTATAALDPRYVEAFGAGGLQGDLDRYLGDASSDLVLASRCDGCFDTPTPDDNVRRRARRQPPAAVLLTRATRRAAQVRESGPLRLMAVARRVAKDMRKVLDERYAALKVIVLKHELALDGVHIAPT